MMNAKKSVLEGVARCPVCERIPDFSITFDDQPKKETYHLQCHRLIAQGDNPDIASNNWNRLIKFFKSPEYWKAA